MATFPHKYTITKETCVISIDGESYDVSSWRNYHPGGAESLDNFHNRDATEAFYALHSKEAVARLKKMAKKPTDMTTLIDQPTKAALAFREFRKKLEKEGWFDRVWLVDALYMTAVVVMAVIATLIARSHPIIASFILGLAIE
jgi:cytochrome b involved in lipid metabolism